MTTNVIEAPVAIPKPTHLLEPGEKAIWWGKPDPMSYAKFFNPMALAIMILASAMFMIYALVHNLTDLDFWIFGLFAVYFAWQASEPVRRYFSANSVIYLVTDHRAIVASGSNKTAVHLLAVGEMLRQSGGHFENLLFFDDATPTTFSGFVMQMPYRRNGFIGITNAAKVEAEMRRLAAGWRPPQ